MVLALIWLDYVIIILVALAFIAAIAYLINNLRKGKASGCSQCPLHGSCHKNIKNCTEKETKQK